MPDFTRKRELISSEDLKIYDGTSTFSRTTSTGGTQSLKKFPVGAIPVIATASLPAASAALDGTIVIEDNGAGDQNLIIYSNGERYRIDGGSNV